MNADPHIYLLLCLAALAAGAVNSIAGGGTLLTFPALVALLPVVQPGFSPDDYAVFANATSTVALVPGSLASAWGYRTETRDCAPWIRLLAGPSLIGGVVGSLLVAVLPAKIFADLVPWLILAAALLFMAQPTITRLVGLGHPHAAPSGAVVVTVVVFQFFVSVYGGYFGAGIGILMLSSLGLMGLADIHRMNAVKTVLAGCINGVSVVVFVIAAKVEWGCALTMAVAAILGGYLGASVARRLNRNLVRWIVILIGFGIAGYFFYKQTLT
jgi:uncharacterized membrane protein YfcA